MSEVLWPRLYTDDSPDSTLALELVREAGFHPVIINVPGSTGPEMKLGSNVCHGLEEIRELITLWEVSRAQESVGLPQAS